MSHPKHKKTIKRRWQSASTVLFAFALVAALLPGALVAGATPAGDNPAIFTFDADFDQGTLVNINHDPADQLQLNGAGEPFNFIWVAVSSKGTVVKIDTTTGDVLGEYATAPIDMFSNPSRTTVDNNGSVWVGNRAEAGFVAQDAIAPGIPPVSQSMGSVAHIGLEENGQCVDRNGNGVIDTSTGLGDVLAWTNAGGADTLGGVSTAADECIVHFTRITSTGARHLSVTAGNDVWASGTGYQNFDLIDDATGAIIRHEASVGYGGYGGLIDGNGVIWSARPMMRWDTVLSPISGNFTGYGHDSYGLCIDSSGNVWNTALSNDQIRKFAPDGTLLGTFSHGFFYAQGCVVDGNDHVWVAHSLLGSGNSVGHLLNDGTYIGNVLVGDGPTGVAVDAMGKIWATNYYSQTVSRIDPTAGPLGADGLTPVGAVDFTSGDLGGLLYNYSDMTGSTLSAPPGTGTWTVVHDSQVAAPPWSSVTWNADTPGDSMITVKVASSADGITFGAEETVSNGGDPTVADLQFLKITVSFMRATTGESPVLYDLTVTHNRPPVADPNGPYLLDINNVMFDGSGSFDPDGDPMTFAWTFGDGNTGTDVYPTHTYAEAGIYDVCLTVNDGFVDSQQVCTTAIIYDPAGGFVTGGGWIDSPPYAFYPPDLPFFDGSYYDWFFTDTPVSIFEANDLAADLTCGTCTTAHLTTITSQAEFDAVLPLLDEWGFLPLGGYQDDGVVPADFGWQWITGEPFEFQPWLPGEPNDCGLGHEGCPPASEQRVTMYPDGWNDEPIGLSDIYSVEYEDCDPGPTGKATFGFVSKYKKGADTPTGNTEFQFHAADLNFHSDTYDWLVVNKGGSRAQFKGTGTINGELAPTGELYKFMLWATDGDPDLFRIKIWYEDGDVVVYDNGFAGSGFENGQPLNGGSIIVHTKGK